MTTPKEFDAIRVFLTDANLNHRGIALHMSERTNNSCLTNVLRDCKILNTVNGISFIIGNDTCAVISAYNINRIETHLDINYCSISYENGNNISATII